MDLFRNIPLTGMVCVCKYESNNYSQKNVSPKTLDGCVYAAAEPNNASLTGPSPN